MDWGSTRRRMSGVRLAICEALRLRMRGVTIEYWLLWAPRVVRVSATVQLPDVRRSAPLPVWLSTI